MTDDNSPDNSLGRPASHLWFPNRPAVAALRAEYPLPCPWCGEQPSCVGHEPPASVEPEVEICCLNEKCAVMPNTYHNTVAEAVAAWNQRMALEAPLDDAIQVFPRWCGFEWRSEESEKCVCSLPIGHDGAHKYGYDHYPVRGVVPAPPPTPNHSVGDDDVTLDSPGVSPASPPGELQAAIEDARHKVDEAKWWINAQGVGCSSRPEMVARLEWAYQRLTLALKLLRAVPAPQEGPP